MKGKEKCRILKEIRQKIADENGIEYITSECKHKGDCRGTCPKCEQEVRDLQRELDKKRRLGRSVAVIGVAAGIALTGVSCTDEPEELNGDIPYVENIENESTDGLLPLPGEEDEPLMGEPEAESPDVPYIDENGNEALNPDTEQIIGELPAYFFPETPEEYEDYSAEFISESMAGMTISEVTEAWGEPDMNQVSGDRGMIAYFIETRDIAIQYQVETGDIINVTVIENG